MATVVTVMDRDGLVHCTDNIVVVQPDRRRLLWVPRDVWCEPLGNRINQAFRKGGHQGLLDSLASLGITADHSICLPRGVVAQALERATVTVAVTTPLRFWYPLTPEATIEEGRKPVDFEPPREDLRGERIHQWLGARYGRDDEVPASDFGRIERQQVFVRALLRQHFDFSVVLDGLAESSFSSPAALDDLRRVRSWWRMAYTDQVADRTLDDGRQVLVLRSPEPKAKPKLPRWRRAVARVGSVSRQGTRGP